MHDKRLILTDFFIRECEANVENINSAEMLTPTADTSDFLPFLT